MSRIACVVAVALLVAGSASAGTVTMHATTKDYKLTLEVGPLETMYTAAEVKAKHPTTGEEMLGSGMNMGGGMSMAAGNRHLEIHVASRATGKVLAVAPSSITLTDTNGMMMTAKVPIVEMEGIGEGMADLHYGNNVRLTAGHTYKVAVAVKGETASFTFRA